MGEDTAHSLADSGGHGCGLVEFLAALSLVLRLLSEKNT